MIDKDKKIAVAQSLNLAVQFVIAKYGKDVSPNHVTSALVKEVYNKLLKGVATEVYYDVIKVPEVNINKFIEDFKAAPDKLSFRNQNLETLSKFSIEEQLKILQALK